jgi:hypothetical protein
MYGLQDVIDFGDKHRGKTLQKAIKDDPDWVAWAADTIDWFDIDAEADDALAWRFDEED